MIARNDLTGIVTFRERPALVISRWPEGWCRIIESGFRQQHDGSSFSGPYEYVHGMYNWSFPCAAVSAVGGGAGAGGAVAPASAPSTGRCENTCGSSYDNECDDGGPGSLYSICALGTDCADCGPR